eukprot:7526737-Pyramimonas_sp.AAC.1
MWADVFAKIAAADFLGSTPVVKVRRFSLLRAQDTMRCLAWAAERVARLSTPFLRAPPKAAIRPRRPRRPTDHDF